MSKITKINREKLRNLLKELELSSEDFYEIFLELFEDRLKEIGKEKIKILCEAGKSEDIIKTQEFSYATKRGDRLAIELVIDMEEVRYCDFSKSKIRSFLMKNLGELAIHRLIEAINDKIELKP